jgi:hypothetical protein
VDRYRTLQREPEEPRLEILPAKSLSTPLNSQMKLRPLSIHVLFAFLYNTRQKSQLCDMTIQALLVVFKSGKDWEVESGTE